MYTYHNYHIAVLPCYHSIHCTQSDTTIAKNIFSLFQTIQLYQVLQINHAVILLGLSGTGKTTIYKTLCKAINSLNTQFASRVSAEGKLTAKEEAKYPKVNLAVLFPRAMSESEVRLALRKWLFVLVDLLVFFCFSVNYLLQLPRYSQIRY